MYIRRLAIFYCTLMLAVALNAEVDEGTYYTRTWMTDEGLPHNIVTHILPDRTGYIWVATAGGVARFDGREFKTFPLPTELQRKGYNIRGLDQLPDGSMLLLLPDGKVVRLSDGVYTVHPVTAVIGGKVPTDLFVEPGGVIWIGTEDGTLFRWENGISRSFGKTDGIDRRAPEFSFAIDSEGRTWIATGRFLGCFSQGSLRAFPNSLGTTLRIAPARSGGIWVLADRQLYRIKANTNVISESVGKIPPHTLPRQICEDTKGGVWVATRRQGLLRFVDGEFKQIPFLSDLTLAIVTDHEGNLWVGSEGWGVSILRERFVTLLNEDDGVPRFAETICADNDGGVWMADRHAGVCHFSRDRCVTVEGTREIGANTIALDGDGRLWIGASSGLYTLEKTQSQFHPTTLRARDIRILHTARNGDVWFVSGRSGLGRIRANSTTLFDIDTRVNERITSVADDAAGHVWIGTNNGTLQQFVDGHFRPVQWPTESTIAPIDALHADSSNMLWIGTAAGLILYSDGKFRRFTINDGLADDLILQINEDDSGHFWLGGSRGIFRVSRDELLKHSSGIESKVTSLKIGKDEGIPSLSLNVGAQPHSARDAQGRLWFTSLQGPVMLDPSRFRASPSPPRVVLEEFRIDGHSINSASTHRFASGRHRIEFQFGLLDYSAIKTTKLQYLLEGIDPDWVDSGDNRIASYSSLPPGDYVMKFRIRSEAGTDSPAEHIINFSIEPAWWQTRFADVLGGTLGLLVAFVAFRRYTHWRLRRQLVLLQQEPALEKERSRIARDLHDELGGSLTLIAFGVDQLKRSLAVSQSTAILEQLSQRVRRHASELRRVVWVESPRNDSLNRICALIEIFAEDYFRETSIQCNVTSQTVVPRKPVAPEVQHHLIAIAKEAFANVLKHSRATRVEVNLEYHAPVFSLKIIDDGIGFSSRSDSDPDHNGFTNMRARAHEIAGDLAIESHPGGGTTILVAWKYRKPACTVVARER